MPLCLVRPLQKSAPLRPVADYAAAEGNEGTSTTTPLRWPLSWIVHSCLNDTCGMQTRSRCAKG